MGKRANGEGTIVKIKKDGKVIGWRAAIVIGYRADGTADRRWVSGKTQEEAKNNLEGIKKAMESGSVIPGERWTVERLLTYHHDHKAAEGIKPNTVRSYRDIARLCIVPHLGKVHLENLRALDVSAWLTKLHRLGMSAARRGYALRILKMALREGVRLEVLDRNVADAIKPPRKEEHEMQFWTEQEALRFMKKAEQDRLGAAFYLALTTGMRRGEVLGLKWTDIDWAKSSLKVRHNLVEVRHESEGRIYQGKPTVSKLRVEVQAPKTKRSKREIPLSPKTMEKLHAHREQQKIEKYNAAEGWTEAGFVFPTPLGTPTDPRNFYTRFQELVQVAGVPRIRLHDLRHTAASLMILRGIPPKTVSERLGHASVAFTLQVYTHLYDQQKEEAVFDLEEEENL